MTTNLPLRSRRRELNMCHVKQESIPSSTKSQPSSASDEIVPAHSISDYNKCDYTKSTIPGSVHNLHVRHCFWSYFISSYFHILFIYFSYFLFLINFIYLFIFLSRAVQELGGGVVLSILLLLFLSVTRAILALLCFLFLYNKSQSYNVTQTERSFII